MKKALLLIGTILLAVSLISCGAKSDKKKVFLITMDQIDQHWVKVDEGAQAATKKMNTIEYRWLAPDVKDDAKQIESINNAVAAGADCILLAANGLHAVTSALKEATDAGVKIIYVDSPADFPAEQLLSTDNKAGGMKVGEALLAKLTSDGITSGNIGIISVNAATESLNMREAGFREAFAQTDFTILETQYSQGDATIAKDMAANFITQDVVGLYGTNEGSTVGIGNAITEATDKNVIGVGSDASDMNKSLVKSGALIGIMAQNPYTMGFEGVKSASKVLAGEVLSESYIDTGVSILTAADL
ncbi:MAG: substrate-binding domain-containing protein [Treponemataceae bacterium]